MAEPYMMSQKGATAKGGVYFLTTVASSFLISASYPPLDLGILGWFGLSPLLFLLRQRRPLSASLIGFIYGVFFGLFAFYWADCIASVNLPSFLVMLFIFALFFLIFGLLHGLVSERVGAWMILGAPALWVAIEYVRSNLSFLSLPWNLMGHSQYRYLPVIQIADITGVYGISFLLVAVNQFVSKVPDFYGQERIKLKRHTYTSHSILSLLIVIFICLLAFSYGWYKLGKNEKTDHLRIALVQANILARNDMSIIQQVGHLRVYGRLTKEAAQKRPAIVIWPASSLPAPITSRVVRFTLIQLAPQIGTHLLVGGAGQDKGGPPREGHLPYSNSEFLISPSGRPVAQYNKIRLLAFNEYLPLQGIIHWPEWITTLKGSFIPGKEYTLFEVSGARFGTPVCWENMFPDLFRRFVKEGANFMACVTNEGFFGRSSTPYYQSLAIYVFRAVENRMAIARSATTGVSCIIHPNGEIVERIRDGNGKDLSVAGFLVRDIPLCNKKTFYTIYGDIFAYGAIGMGIGIILVSFLMRKENSTKMEK
jgi:apolipoprotein N-acyltransferase